MKHKLSLIQNQFKKYAEKLKIDFEEQKCQIKQFSRYISEYYIPTILCFN
jgi:ribosomal protein S17E